MLPLRLHKRVDLVCENTLNIQCVLVGVVCILNLLRKAMEQASLKSYENRTMYWSMQQ